MQDKYKTVRDFLDDLKELESVKEVLIDMGYVQPKDFYGGKIRCLFHNDKTPSLQITDKFFKCYGCDAKGDLVSFIMLKDKLGFNDAVIKLCEYFNCDIEQHNYKPDPILLEMRELWEKYKASFEKYKFDSKIKKVAEKFYPMEVGYDEKIGYIVLPFTSKTGQILGFVKRRTDDEKQMQKYLNSTMEDSLIGECNSMFNVSNCLSNKGKNNEIYVVEGSGDVAGMQRNGKLNVVGLCGSTKLTWDRLQLLQPLQNIILAMDGDDAGRKATRNFIVEMWDVSPKISLAMKVLDLPDGEDPGSMKDLSSCEEIPAIDWLVSHISVDDIQYYWEKCKSKIIEVHLKKALKDHFFLTDETFKEITSKKFENKKNNDEYLEKLKAVVGLCDDVEIQPLQISAEEAKSILSMRYGIDIE